MKKILALFLISLVVFASAHDDEEESDDNDSNDRDVQYDYQSDEVEFNSQDSSLGNEIKFTMKTGEDDGVRFSMEFKTVGTGSDDNSGEDSEDYESYDDRKSSYSGFLKNLLKRDDGEDENKLKVEGVLMTVYEYVDNDSNGQYTDGEEVSTVNLGDVAWTDIECTEGSVYQCTTSSDYMQLDIYLTDAVAEVGDNTTLKPTAAKLDITFFKQTDNNLALVAGFKVEAENGDDEVDREDESDEEREGIASNEAQVSLGSNAFFSWAETATFQDNSGSTIDVVASDPYAESGYDVVIFSFQTADQGTLLWDPKMAVKGTTALSINGAGMIFPSVALLFAVLALFL